MIIRGDFQTTVRKALTEIDKNWNLYPGLVICGSHDPKDVDTLIDLIKDARERSLPYLGICYGHQLAAIEYARNVLGITDATSEEFGKGTFVVKKREELKVGLHDGESYWNNYDVVIDWKKPSNFFTSQFHPEYESSIEKPHPFLIDFLKYCKYIYEK